MDYSGAEAALETSYRSFIFMPGPRAISHETAVLQFTPNFPQRLKTRRVF
jgi:hypothetical protein